MLSFHLHIYLFCRLDSKVMKLYLQVSASLKMDFTLYLLILLNKTRGVFPDPSKKYQMAAWVPELWPKIEISLNIVTHYGFNICVSSLKPTSSSWQVHTTFWSSD